MKQSAILAVAGSVDLGPKPDKKNNQFVHHVFFYLNDNTEANRDKLVEGLKKLTKIKLIKSYNIGIPAKSDREVVIKDYSLSWLVFFSDAKAEKEYQVDPIHLKFVEEYKHLWREVKVFDTEAVIFKNN